MATTAISPFQEQTMRLEKIKKYTQDPEVVSRFIELLGDRDGRAYVSAVYIVVLNSAQLQECSPKSIMIESMRAAALRLSVDPATKQAHLVAYKKEAKLIVDYHGLVELMNRTHLYEDINVSEVYEGETVEKERLSGRCKIAGEKKSDKVQGWMAYFKKKDGTEKFLYMTNEECDAHGKRYNPGGFSSERGVWTTERDKMRRKTALRCLCNQWAQYSPYDTAILQSAFALTDGSDLPSDANIKLPAPKPRNAKHEAALKEQGLGMEVYRADSEQIVGAVADIVSCDMETAQAHLLATYAPGDMLSIGDARKFAAQIEPEQAPLISE